MTIQTLCRRASILAAALLLTACAQTQKLAFWQDSEPAAPSGTTLLSDVSPNGAIGGLAWLDEATLLIARDSKNYDGVRFSDLSEGGFARVPLALARKSPDGLTLSAIKLGLDNPVLRAELAPNDIEAICQPDRKASEDGSFTVIAVESHRTHYDRPDPGQLFLMKVAPDSNDWQANVTGALTLPRDFDLAGNIRDVDNVQVEGLACLKQPSGKYSILIGYRGQHSLPPSPDDYVGMLALFRDVSFESAGDQIARLPDLSDARVTLREIGAAVTPACVGKEGHDGGEWRDIADLYVTRNGDILTASSYEGADTDATGPFCSTLYKTGYHLDFDGHGWRLDGDGTPMRLKDISGIKVEALTPEKPGSKNLILGYDNEDLGSGIVTP